MLLGISGVVAGGSSSEDGWELCRKGQERIFINDYEGSIYSQRPMLACNLPPGCSDYSVRLSHPVSFTFYVFQGNIWGSKWSVFCLWAK